MRESPTPPTDADDGDDQWTAFDALAETTGDGVVVLDDDSVVRYANPEVERILEYAPGELVGESALQLVPEQLRDRHGAAMQRYLDTSERRLDWDRVELPGRHKDGHEVSLAMSLREFTDGGDHFFVGTFRDISDRRETEQELHKRRRQLQTLLELLPVGVIVADADGSLVEANETAKRVWGGFADADSIAEYDQYTGWWAETGEAVAPDEWPLSRALAGERVTDADLIEIERFDGERRSVLFHAMPIRDDGDVERAVVTMVDVTERERRKRRLEIQNERLDRFASMLAHELRNPLEIAQIYLGFLDDPDESAFEQIADALDRIDDIIEVLLVLARGHAELTDREPVGLTGAAKDAWRSVDTRDAELKVRSSRVVDANPTHLQQLLENLFRNSVEHADGPVTVRVGALDDGFYVEDTGPGIPEEKRESVLEAGFTTETDGTGLGLTFVSELANAYDWEWTIADGEDGGARFEFRDVSRQDPLTSDTADP